MIRWLFNSKGEPIALADHNHVFSDKKRYIGRLDGNEVWHGKYKGEIVQDDRFLYERARGNITRGRSGVPLWRPNTSKRPRKRKRISLPSGYRDVDSENWRL